MAQGKGKVAAYMARDMSASTAIRCGGSNSGHTAYDNDGKRWVLRQLPTACIQPNIKCVLAAGTYIDVDVLMREINATGITNERLFIDPNAVIITDDHKAEERSEGLISSIGSTGSGTGAAVVSRITRKLGVLFAHSVEELKPFLCDTKILLNGCLNQNERIIVEGTQGFGLSLLHSYHYPCVTSRDTTAAGFLSECGISPLDVDDIVLVIRAHPIRVSGSSGPLPNEIDWETVTRESGQNTSLCEYTTVTQNIRRVARFDPQVVKRAIQVNKPTRIVLNHLDYVAPENRSNFLKEIAFCIDADVDYVGLSPASLHSRSEEILKHHHVKRVS